MMIWYKLLIDQYYSKPVCNKFSAVMSAGNVNIVFSKKKKKILKIEKTLRALLLGATTDALQGIPSNKNDV